MKAVPCNVTAMYISADVFIREKQLKQMRETNMEENVQRKCMFKLTANSNFQSVVLCQASRQLFTECLWKM